MQNIIDIGYTLINWLKEFSVVATALALIVGGITHSFGGQHGFEKAKMWYIGGAVGLVFSLGSTTITDWLKSIMQF